MSGFVLDEILKLKGSYLLLIRLAKAQIIKVGRLGTVDFHPGFYIYVGSAMGGFRSRIRRHLSKNQKLFWHIDYLLARASIDSIILSESSKRTECLIARALMTKFEGVPGFGSSDCQCQTHLFYAPDGEEVKSGIAGAFILLGEPHQQLDPTAVRRLLPEPSSPMI